MCDWASVRSRVTAYEGPLPDGHGSVRIATSVWRRPARLAAWAGAIIIVAALGAVYWTALSAPAVGLFHDDGIYAVTAKALATGHGYRILSLPDESAQTKYPFLFPALLAVVWKVFPGFPDNTMWLKAVPLVCALLWWGLSYMLVKRETASAPAALGVTGLVVAAPWVLFLSTALLSETLFAALATGALVLLGRAERGGRWRGLAAAGALAGLAFLTRTVGIALIPAGVLALGLRRRPKAALAFAVVALALAVPWLWWQARDGGASLDPYYSRVNYESWNILSRFTLAQKAWIASENLGAMLLAPAVLMGAPGTVWGAGLALLVGGLALAGLGARLARRPAALEIFVLMYCAMVVCWAWPPVRFLAPLLPVSLLYGYEGLCAACRGLHLGNGSTRMVMVGVGVVLASQSAWTLAGTAAAARALGSVNFPNVPQDDWRETARMLAWIAHNTPPDAVLMGNLDPVFYLYTGRKSVRGFVPDPYLLHYAGLAGVSPLGTAGALWRAIERDRVTYLVCAPNAAFSEGRYLVRLSAEVRHSHEGRFRLVYESGDKQYGIYAITLDGRPLNLSLKPNFQENVKLLASN